MAGRTKTIVNEEKRIGDFSINSATYGSTVPVILGTSRISGNVIDWFDFTAIAHESTQETGKGGKTRMVDRSYTYTVAVLVGLCEGPVLVGRVWKDKEVYSTPDQIGLSIFQGFHGQAPWAYTLGRYPWRALPYSGLAYLAGVFDLGSAGSLPVLNFETFGFLRETGDGLDVNPADAVKFILTDPTNGVGLGTENIDMASLNRYRTFCTAADLLITAPLTEQREAYQIIKDICDATNTICYWSQDKLKFVPRCDERLERNGVVFEPITTPEYDLGPDDFLEAEDGRLVIFERDDNADAYNHTTVEFINRANQYKVELAEHKIQVDISRRGLRSAPTRKCHYLHTKPRADYVASLQAMESLYGRTKYKFRLGWSHCLLEPGDFVTLTEPTIGLNKKPVIIESIDEDDFGTLEAVARERPPGLYSPGRYQTSSSDRPTMDLNVEPGNVASPVIFEPPAEAVSNGLELCLAVCGQSRYWGGAYVWASYDGHTYKQIGQITAAARVGRLEAELKEGRAKDYQNRLSVMMTRVEAKLGNGTVTDADVNNTLCYVDGEFISYETAILQGPGRYALQGLRRGVYGSKIKAHPIGSDFVRLDKEVLRHPYRVEDLGRTIHIKLTSFNIFGLGLQDLAHVSAYQYTIGGGSNNIPVVGFTITQNGENLTATLDRVYTDQANNSFYTFELRFGSSWDNSTLIADFSSSTITFRAPQEGTLTFWLKAKDNRGNVSPVASRTVVNVIGIPKKNIVFDRIEDINTWIVSHMYRVPTGYRIQERMLLRDFEHFADIFGAANYLSDEAYIYLPPIDLGENIIDAACYWVDPWGGWHLKTVETLRDYPRFADIFGATLHYVTPRYAVQTFANIEVRYEQRPNTRLETQYRSSFDGQVWSEWMPGTQKQFYGRHVEVRLKPISLDGHTNFTVYGASISIDVPDIEDLIINIALPAQKTHIPFHKRFTAPPLIGVFTQDLTGKHATWRLSNITVDGFDIELLDAAGNLIAGKLIQAIARGY